MPIYLIIEERDGDELMSYRKYDITEPQDVTLIPLPKDNTALQIAWVDDLKEYYRRVDGDPNWLEPRVGLGANSVPSVSRS